MILVLALMGIALFSGCGDPEKEVMLEKREYISTSIKKVINGQNDDAYKVLLEFSEKNKDKYVQWKINVDKIDGNYTIEDNVDNGVTKVVCEFDYSIKDIVKLNDEIIISGKVLDDYSLFSPRIILANCRIEKLSEKELTQIKTDEEAYDKAITDKNKALADAKVKSETEIKAKQEAKDKLEAEDDSKAQKEANKIISTDFISFEQAYKNMTDLQKGNYVKTIKGRNVQWTGRVDDVDANSISIICFDSTLTIDIQASVLESENDKLINIKKGSKITVKGRIISAEGSFLPWLLGDCVIVQ